MFDHREPTRWRRPVRHAGGCGQRIPCPKHGQPLGPDYLPAERLRNGTVIAHDCGAEIRPGELELFAWTASRG